MTIYQSAEQLGGFCWVFWLAMLSSVLLLFSVAFFDVLAYSGCLPISTVWVPSWRFPAWYLTGGFESSPFTVLLPLVALFAFIMASIWTAFLWAGLGLLLWWYGVTLEGGIIPIWFRNHGWKRCESPQFLTPGSP